MKKLIIGLVIGLLIGSMGTVLAATDSVQAVFAKFNIKINDNEPIEIQPLTYGGKTYLPVREVGDLLGFDVDFDNLTRTIIFELKEKEDVKGTIVELISLRELDGYLDDISLGPFENYSNVLSLSKGSVVIRIINFVPPKDSNKQTYSILGGGTIDAEFNDGNTFFPINTLVDLGLITPSTSTLYE